MKTGEKMSLSSRWLFHHKMPKTTAAKPNAVEVN